MYESSRSFYRQRSNSDGVVFQKKKELHIQDESLPARMRHAVLKKHRKSFHRARIQYIYNLLSFLLFRLSIMCGDLDS